MIQKYQTGAALVVSLVILVVVTLIGVAAMQNSSLELKLVASTKDRATAFQIAEAAVALVEQQLDSAGAAPTLDQLSNNCAGANCFVDCSNGAMSNGLCFQGLYNNGQGRANCVAANPNAPTAIDPVAIIKAGNFQSVPIVIQQPVGVPAPPAVRVLIEFQCFVARPSSSGNKARVSSEENSASNSIDALNTQLDPLYRITAVAAGPANRSNVVLQTTFRSTRQ